MSMILSERRGDIAVLTLNNPAQYNAIAAGLIEELSAAVDRAAASGDVRCIVITGAGKGFCAGAQFGGDTFSRGAAIGDGMRATINPMIEKLRASRIPIVAAVNGPAAGAGVGVALAADIVIAARSARFILSFARLGAVLDGGTSLFIQRAIGAPRARALAMLAEPLSAELAAQWGLIWKVVDDAALLDEAMAVARRLADGPPIALGEIKVQLESAWSAPLAVALDDEASAQTRAFVTEDLREGAAAFVEKRAARFKGR